MEQVWKTVDGQTFKSQEEAFEHEKQFAICDGIEIYDFNGVKRHFIDTFQTCIVRISKDIAKDEFEKWKDIFLTMDDENWGDTDADEAIKAAAPGDIVYWDDLTESYHVIQPSVQKLIIKNKLL